MRIRLNENVSRADKDNMFILGEQLMIDRSDYIRNMPSTCSSCQKKDRYKIWIQKNTFVVNVEKVYWARCMSCGDSFELSDADYALISPILKLNMKYDSGKIDQLAYDKRYERIHSKIRRKRRL